MRFDNKTTKQLATKVTLSELSGVTTGAHEGANVTIFKMGEMDPASLFAAAVSSIEERSAIWSIVDKVWDYTDVLYDIAYKILNNPTDYPEPLVSFKLVLTSFAEAALSLQKNGEDVAAKEELKKIISKDSLKVMKIIRDSTSAVSATTKKVSEEMATKEEKLSKQVGELEASLKAATALSLLTDGHKAHLAKLSETEQADFLLLDAAGKDAQMAKSQDADPVIYTATGGEEYRQSDNPRLVKMAKRQDESDKAYAELQKAADETRLVKAAEDTMSHLPGEVADKAALLKAVETVKDLDQRARICKIIAAQNGAMGELFVAGGTQTAKNSATATDQLEEMAKAHQDKNKVTFDVAYDQVCQTTEGAALYAQM